MVNICSGGGLENHNNINRFTELYTKKNMLNNPWIEKHVVGVSYHGRVWGASDFSRVVGESDSLLVGRRVIEVLGSGEWERSVNSE